MRTRKLATPQKAFSLGELLVVVSAILVLGRLVVQSGCSLRSQAEASTLVTRAGHLGAALQLYYQKHRSYPNAYPSRLEEDLAAAATELWQ